MNYSFIILYLIHYAHGVPNMFIGSMIEEISPSGEPPEDCPPCECGKANLWLSIVGGNETEVLEYPWMTLLLHNGRFICGGSLINDYYVLTAAHCTGFDKESLSVRFLEHDRSDINETKTIERNISAIIRHELYASTRLDNDIALLKLDRRVDLSNTWKATSEENSEEEEDSSLRPVCLPSPGLTYADYSGIVSGWGATSSGGAVSNVLMHVIVDIISNEECRQSGNGDIITDNMLCAGVEEGGRDACKGDSGGPLHVHDPDTDRYQEVGIVSWGIGCARPDHPGVYTRVNRYLSWIEEHTRDACYCTNIAF